MNNYFQWPFSGLPPEGTVRTDVLPNPDELVYAQDTKCTYRRAYDGSVQTHRKPKQESLRIAIANITHLEFEHLQETVRLYWKYASTELYPLKYVDPENQTWRVVITVDSLQGIMNTRIKDDNELYSTSILLNGTRI